MKTKVIHSNLHSVILISLTMMLFTSCHSVNNKIPPVVKNGIIDLSNWNFEKDGLVELKGNWEFYFNGFINVHDFDTVSQKHFIKAPLHWNILWFEKKKADRLWNGEKIPDFGYASYRLKIVLPKRNEILKLVLNRECVAYRLFLNDSLLAENGIPAKNRKFEIPEYHNLLVDFYNTKDTINFVYHISNFHYWKGGLLTVPIIGKNKQILENVIKINAEDYFFAGILLIFSIIVLIFYFFKRSDYILLLFSLFGFFTLIRIISTGNTFLYFIAPHFSWEWQVKMELIPVYTTSFFLTLCVKVLYKKEFPDYLLFFILGNSMICITAAIFTPAYIHSYFLIFGQMILLLFPFAIYPLIKAIYRKKEGAYLLLFATIIVIITVALDILSRYKIVNLPIPYFWGVLVFLLSIIILLAFRFSNSYKRIENFANELEQTVIKRTTDLRIEKEKSEKLLLNVLPQPIADRLKEGEAPIADYFDEASVVFVDIVNFTVTSSRYSPRDVVKMLNDIFTLFDKVSTKYGLEKIKTIGDCYMAAAGIPKPRADHALAALQWAIEVNEMIREYTYIPVDDTSLKEAVSIQFRTGLNCGSIVAGVIGEQKFIYDLWGDMVNSASRMESNSVAGKIQCTQEFKEKLETYNENLNVAFIDRGVIEIKGKGKMRTWFIEKA